MWASDPETTKQGFADGANVNTAIPQLGSDASGWTTLAGNGAQWKADAGVKLNNKPALEFNNSDSLACIYTEDGPNPAQLTVIAVGYTNLISGTDYWFDGYDGDVWRRVAFYQTDTVWGMSLGSGGTSTAPSDTDAHVVMINANYNGEGGNSDLMYVDDVLRNSASLGNPTSMEGVSIGSAGSGSFLWGGFIAFYGIYEGTLQVDEPGLYQSLMDFLGSFYNLPVGRRQFRFNTTLPDLSDLDGDGVNYDFEDLVENGNSVTWEIENGPSGIDFNGGILEGTLGSSASASSPYTATITATNNDGQELTQNITWTITNRPPIQLQDLKDRTSVDEQVIENFDVSTYFESPDGDTVTHTIQSGAPSGISCSTAGLYSGTIADGENASSPFTVTHRVTDSDGGYVEGTFTWTVNETPGANNDPVVDTVIPDQENNDEEVINLDISSNFSDPDGDTLTFSVSAGALPTGLSLSSAGVISGTIADGASASSPFSITIEADDGNGGTVTDAFSWTVNDPPDFNKVVDAGGGGDYLTIQAAIDAAQSGDYIRIVAGDYDESPRIAGLSNVSFIGDTDNDGWPLVRMRPPDESVTWTNTSDDVWETTDFGAAIEILSFDDGVMIPFMGPHTLINYPDFVNAVFFEDDGTDVYHQLAGRGVDYDNEEGIVFWECFKSCAYQDAADSDKVYIRFADGTDPNDLDIRASYDTGETDIKFRVYGGTNQNLIFKNIAFFGHPTNFQARTALGSSAADGLQLENCHFSAQRDGIDFNYASGATVTDCRFDNRFHVQTTGAWGAGSSTSPGVDRDTGNRQMAYEFEKYIHFTSDSHGIGLKGFYAADLTVTGCDFMGGMQGANLVHNGGAGQTQNGDGFVFDDCTFVGHSSLGFYITPGSINGILKNSEFENCNSSIRAGSQDKDFNLSWEIFNNLFVNPEGIGNHWRNHWYAGGGALTTSRDIRLYHNTFAGGRSVMTYETTRGNVLGGLPYVSFQNNLFDSGYRVFGKHVLDSNGESVGLFDYNWHGSGDSNTTTTAQTWYGANNDEEIGNRFWAGSYPQSLVVPGASAVIGAAGTLPVGWTALDSASSNMGCDLNDWAASRNLLTASHDFTDASWSTTGLATIAADTSVTDPFGGTGAYLMEDDGTTSSYHMMYASNAAPENNGELIFSIYVREVAGSPLIGLGNRSSLGADAHRTWYKFLSNQHRHNDSGGTWTRVGSEYANYGWRRIWAIWEPTGATTDDPGVFLREDDDEITNTPTYPAASESYSVHIFGAQLEYANGRRRPTPLETITP